MLKIYVDNVSRERITWANKAQQFKILSTIRIRFKQLRAASAFWLMFHYIKWSLNVIFNGAVKFRERFLRRYQTSKIPDIKLRSFVKMILYQKCLIDLTNKTVLYVVKRKRKFLILPQKQENSSGVNELVLLSDRLILSE